MSALSEAVQLTLSCLSFFTLSTQFTEMNCACLLGDPPSCLPLHPDLLSTGHRCDGMTFQSWFWWGGSVWHRGDFLVDEEHLLSSCRIPPRDTIKPLPMQLVFTGGCFASSKTTFFLLLQVKAERTHMKTFQIWNKHFHTGSYDTRHRVWLTPIVEWTAHTRITLGQHHFWEKEQNKIWRERRGWRGGERGLEEERKRSHNLCGFIVYQGLLLSSLFY